MVASYGGPYSGNFIPSLIAYDKVIKQMGFRTVYIFPDFVEKYAWVETMKNISDSVYFIPYKPYSYDNVRRIRSICKTEHAILLYSRMSGWEITGRFAMPGLPMIWHFEMGLDLSKKRSRLKYWAKYNLLGFGKTYHIAVSESAAKAINSLHTKYTCEWIANAINIDRLIPKQATAFQTPIHLLIFAYQPIIKGLDLALDAVEKLNKNRVRFILMASAQKHTYEYIEERYSGNAPEWVELLEPTDNIKDLFCQADILISASRSEGLSFANLEGLYSGLPVVYSKIPGNQLLAEFKMTYPFISENANSLAEQIEKCASELVSKNSQEKNREIILDRFSMDAWSNRIAAFLRRVLTLR